MISYANTIMAAIILLQGGYIYLVDAERDAYKLKVETINLKSKADKDRYERYMKSYDNAMKDIVTYYEAEKNDLANFERRGNETDCEAATRLLNSIKY